MSQEVLVLLLLAAEVPLALTVVLLGIALFAESGWPSSPGYGAASLIVGLFQLVILLVLVHIDRQRSRSKASAETECRSGKGRPDAFKACVPAEDAVAVDCAPVPQEAWPAPPAQLVGPPEPASAKVADFPDLRKQSDDRAKELLKSLAEAKQELQAAGQREARLREAGRIKSANLMRLASHLTRVQKKGACQSTSSQTSEVQAQESKSQEVQTIEAPEQASKEVQSVALSEDACVQTEREEHAPSQVVESQVPASPLASSADPSRQDDASVPQSPVAVKLAHLASASPEMRELVLRRLRSARGMGEEEDDGEAEAELQREAVPSVSASAAEVAKKLAEQVAASQHWQEEWQREAAEAEHWREECRFRSSQLQVLTQEAAACREAADAKACEASQLGYRLRAMELQLQAQHEELERCRKEKEVRQVVLSASGESPELCLRWVDDCKPMSSEPGSSIGVKQLKQSLACVIATGPSELVVGPPPADWKVFIQLRLRHHEPWDPALLRLTVPGGEESSFIGLLWPTSSMSR